MAIPKGLVSRDMLKGMQGIKCSRTSILPANSSGDFKYNPSGNSRVIFQIPQFENSYINQKRSYLKFKLTATGAHAANALLTPAAPVFRRLMLKNTRGQVLSDIDNYDVLCRIKQNLKTREELEARLETHRDFRPRGSDVISDYSGGRTVIHELHDGLLGKENEYMIPISAMSASGSYAFQLELWLNDVSKVFFGKTGGAADSVANIGYELTDLSLELELVEVPNEIMRDINSELQGGNMIPLPYKHYRSFQNHIASGKSYKAFISESAHNVNAVYSVMLPQQHATTIGVSKSSSDYPYKFLGGKGSTAVVSKYVYRYGSKYYPLAPVDLVGDSVLALENTISGFELDDKVPYLSTRFDAENFMLTTNFKTTNDPILNGLNSSSSGASIEADLSFESSVSNIEIFTFVESQATLYIKQNGESSIVAQ